MERKLYISKLVSHHCSHGSLNPAGSHFYNYIDMLQPFRDRDVHNLHSSLNIPECLK